MDSGDLIAGRYRLGEQIGEGGMGAVWLATDTRLRRTVALKLGKPSARIPHEGVGGAKLMHPNVITVFDVTGDDGGREWLVMEYLPSRSVKRIRDEDGPLSPPEVAAIGAQIASALAHLHAKGMVHRDVSPANVLVTAEGTAKLADFGIATWDSETQAEDPKTGGGAPGFRAPEVARGNRATEASDIYSLGATLAAAIEGHHSAEAGPNGPLRTALDTMAHQNPERRPTAEQAQRLLTDLARGKSKRVWWAVGTAAVVVSALVVWWVSAPHAGDPAASPAPGHSAPTGTGATSSGPGPLIGDPRTADPCGLTYANALAGYGDVEPTNDYGNFNRCDVLVYPTQDHQNFVDVKVEFEVGQQDPGVPVQQVGTIGIQRPPADSDGCGRMLLLPGDYQVSIDAQEDGNAKADWCGMADAVASGALVTLNSGQIPRRRMPAASLANKDACALLDAATVTAAVGTGLTRQPHFGNWQCDWSDPNGPRLVQVKFDQTSADSGEITDGTPIRPAGYAGRVQPQGDSDTGCDVTLVYRTYTDSTGTATDEVVEVNVDDSDQPPTQLCAPAQRLAATAAQRLAG